MVLKSIVIGFFFVFFVCFILEKVRSFTQEIPWKQLEVLAYLSCVAYISSRNSLLGKQSCVESH